MILENRFYMTYARSRHKDIIPLCEKHDIGIMNNAAHRYSDNTKLFKSMYNYDCPRIIDSGGYNVQSNYGGYPWTVGDYHNWLSENKDKFQWAAIMDLACEKRFDNLHSVNERVEITTNNTLQHYELEPDYNILPILQGRSIDRYLEHYDTLKDHGIPLKHVGLGTICRISSSDKIIETEKRIRQECKDIEKIHGFGVKIDAYKRGATFESADSQAWVYPASNGKCYVQNGKGLSSVPMPDNSRLRTVWSFVNYYDYVTGLNDNFPDSDIDIGLANLIDGAEAGTTGKPNGEITWSNLPQEAKDLSQEYPKLSPKELFKRVK